MFVLTKYLYLKKSYICFKSLFYLDIHTYIVFGNPIVLSVYLLFSDCKIIICFRYVSHFLIVIH
jgi:hypothetical protein